jgi:hypothetical protein
METPEYVALIRGQGKELSLHATGIAIAADGLLVTCHHVISELEGDASVEVKFPNRKGIRYYVLPDHRIPEHDVALLVPEVILDPPLPDIQLELASGCPEKGAELIGYGWADQELYESAQEHRFFVSGYMPQWGRIGLDGHANPGDSGGPLYDKNGVLTGIIQWRDDTREGHAAAIPAATLGRILDVPQRRHLLGRCYSSLQDSLRSISGQESSLAFAAPRTSIGGSPARDVVLISCSSHKRSDREPHPLTHTIADTITNQDLAREVLACRRKIRELLQMGVVNGVEFQEGNRAARPENRELILGADFGGRVNEPRYLPAYWRYSGRCYRPERGEWSSFFAMRPEERPTILVMSGLYGLFDIREYIQNYDCHLTDTTGEGTIADIWRPIATEILLSRFDRIERSGFRLRQVVDLLSERSYQEIFDWAKVNKRTRVLHRKFERLSDRDALANMGMWLWSVVRDPHIMGSLESDRFFKVEGALDEDKMMLQSHV